MSAAAGYQWTFVSRAHYNPDAITSIKAWGSAGDAGPTLGSLVKQLLVKFNRRLWFKPPSNSLSSSASLCFFSSPYLMSFLLHCPFPHPPPLHLFLSSSSFSFVFIEYLFLHTNGCVYLCFFLRVYSVCLLLQLILIISFYPVTFTYHALPLYSLQLHQHQFYYTNIFFYADGLCCDFHLFLNVLDWLETNLQSIANGTSLTFSITFRMECVLILDRFFCMYYPTWSCDLLFYSKQMLRLRLLSSQRHWLEKAFHMFSIFV